MSMVEAIEGLSAIVALGASAILLLLGREDATAAWPFFAMLLASGAIMLFCEFASTITKGG